MKPSRNDLCPCGSGKKYKKCCIDKPLAAAVDTSARTVSHQADISRPTAEALYTEIVALYTAGKKEELKEKASAFVEQFPESGLAWKAWGAALQMLGQDSLSALQRAVLLQPNDPESHSLLGVAFTQAGRQDEAEACFRRVLEIMPTSAPALGNLASMLSDRGKYAEAEELLKRAIASAPHIAETHQNLSALQRRQGRFDDAMQSIQAALKIKPGMADAHFNLGAILVDLKRMEEAEICFRNVLLLQPSHARACIGVGNVLIARGALTEAEDFFQRATQLDSTLTEAYIGLSIVFFEFHRLEEAEVVLQKALQINPNSAIAYSNLGPVLTRLKRLDEAVVCFKKALQIQPNFSAAYNGLGVTLKLLGRQSEGEDAFREALRINPNDISAHSNLLGTLNFNADSNNDEMMALAHAYDRNFCLAHAGKLPPPPNSKEPERRLRIGYVSGDFRHHAVAYFLEPILANHDKSRVEIFCYAEEKRTDEFTERFRTLADRWRPTQGLTDDAMAQTIRDDSIDILIDLAGHTEGNRLRAFARKPAPIQCTYLGYPGTTGLSSIDYRILDRYTAPVGMIESSYTEQLLRMPDSLWCFRPMADMPEPNALPALANRYVTFGSFNNFNKIDHSTITLWAELLRTIPDSHLVMVTVPVGESRERLVRQFGELGVEENRIQFYGKMGHEEFHKRFGEIDISLDPLHVNGATTTCESLWMGVPVISLIGPRFLMRAGLSLLSAAGVPEFAAESPEDYIRIAVDLAGDLHRLAETRAGLRARLSTSALSDEILFTRNLEGLYRQIWRHWCA